MCEHEYEKWEEINDSYEIRKCKKCGKSQKREIEIIGSYNYDDKTFFDELLGGF